MAAPRLRFTVGVRLLSLLLAVGGAVLSNRGMGPEGRGWFAAATGMAGFATQLLLLGVPTAYTYWCSRHASQTPVLKSNLRLWTLVYLGLSLVFWGAASVVGNEVRAFSLPLLVLCLALTWTSAVQNLLTGYMVGQHLLHQASAVELRVRLLTCVVYAALYLQQVRDARFYLATACAASLFSALLTARAAGAFQGPWAAPSSQLMRANVAHGLKLWTAQLGASVILQLDVVAVDAMLGHRQAGYYAIAITLCHLLYVPFGTLFNHLVPVLSALPNEERWRCWWRFLPRVAASLLLCLGLGLLVARPLLLLLFGSRFEDSLAIINFVLPGFLLQILNEYNGLLVLSSHPDWAVVLPAWLAAGAAWLAIWWVIPERGLTGAGLIYLGVRLFWLLAGLTYTGWLHRQQRGVEC